MLPNRCLESQEGLCIRSNITTRCMVFQENQQQHNDE
jgi:hypothetical protein